MDGPEHYREAEVQLGAAQQMGANSPVGEAAHLRYAQVHATLALVAATIDAAPTVSNGEAWVGVVDGR